MQKTPGMTSKEVLIRRRQFSSLTPGTFCEACNGW